MARRKKIKTISIRSMADLVELVNSNTYAIDKALLNLSRKNRRMGIIGVFAAVIAVSAVSECRRLDDELYRLKIRLDKLEYKGE